MGKSEDFTPLCKLNDQDFFLRPMLVEDLPKVMVIERLAYPFPWTEKIFKDCLAAHYSCWIAEKKIMKFWGMRC